MRSSKTFLKSVRVIIAFIVVMSLWYLWDRFVGEDTIWKYLAMIVATALIYAVEVAIAGSPRDS